MKTIWTNPIVSATVTELLDTAAHDLQGGKSDWNGRTAYGFATVEKRNAFFAAAKKVGFDLHSGVSAA
jgi:hypothetical protein